jgi:hypothetical protein
LYRSTFAGTSGALSFGPVCDWPGPVIVAGWSAGLSVELYV